MKEQLEAIRKNALEERRSGRLAGEISGAQRRINGGFKTNGEFVGEYASGHGTDGQ